MKNYIKKNLILLLILVLGVAVAAGIVIQRAAEERNNKTYDLVVDYSDFRDMSYQSSENLGFWLNLLHENGINKVALFGTNIKALAKEPESGVQYFLMEDILEQSNWQDNYPAELVSMMKKSEHTKDLLILSSDREKFDWILNAFQTRTDNLKLYPVYSDNCSYLWIPGNPSNLTGDKWITFDLGLWPEHVEKIQNAGMQVVPRFKAIKEVNGDTFAKAVIEELKASESPYFMNSGDDILGFDNEESTLVKKYLSKSDSAIVVTEQMNEQGNVQWDNLGNIVEATDYNIVRAFNMWDYIQCRWQSYNYEGAEEITNTLYRAVYERNCHLIILRAILEKNPEKTDDKMVYITEPDAYADMISAFHDRMEARGYTHETLTSGDYNTPSFIALILLAAGGIAGAVLLLEAFIPLADKTKYLLWGICTVAAAGVLFVMPNTGKIILCICLGILMPCLAGISLNRYIQQTYGAEKNLPRLIGEILMITCICFIICFGGSLFVSASLCSPNYIMEMQLYRGVKLMQLIPIALFCFSYLQCFFYEKYVIGNRSTYTELSAVDAKNSRKNKRSAFLEKTVKVRAVWYGIIAVCGIGFAGMIGVYYILRTGNSSADLVPSLESEIRNLMEQYLTARPRTKEFLVGWPAFMLTVWAFRRRIPGIPLLFGAGAMIGLTSVVNTFLHIRTMVGISFARVLTSFGFGLVIGLIAVLCFEIIYRLIRRKMRI